MPTFTRCLDCGVRFQKTRTLRSRCETCQRKIWNESNQLRRQNQKRPGAARGSLPRQVKQRDGGRCVQCGAADRLEAHHIVPLAAGGANEPANLVTLCRTCHAEAHRREQGG